MDVEDEADVVGGDQFGQGRLVGGAGVVVGVAPGAGEGVEGVGAAAFGDEAGQGGGEFVFLLVAAVAPVGRAVGGGEQNRQRAGSMSKPAPVIKATLSAGSIFMFHSPILQIVRYQG